jgi:hypothetical protein
MDVDSEKQLQQFGPCIDSFGKASIDDSVMMLDLLKRSMKSNRKLPIESTDSAVVQYCLNTFQSISDDIVCATIIEMLQQIYASKFSVYTQLKAHFSPAKFRFEFTAFKPQLTMLISSVDGGSKCVKLKLESPVVLHVDSLNKCHADGGPGLLQAILSFAKAIKVNQITLTDGAHIDICGVSIPLAPLKIVTTGRSWYNHYGYHSDNFSNEYEQNQRVINRSFNELITERPDIFPPSAIERMRELMSIDDGVTFADYILRFEKSIGRNKECHKEKATLLRYIMQIIDDDMYDSNFVSQMDSSYIPFLIYCPDLHLDVSRHGGNGGKRRRLQTMRNSKKGAKNSKRNINKSKRNINKSKRNINKIK